MWNKAISVIQNKAILHKLVWNQYVINSLLPIHDLLFVTISFYMILPFVT